MTDHYEAKLIAETKDLFDEFVSDLKTSGFEQIQIEFHTYPVPSMSKLLEEVKKALENICV